MGNIGVGKTTYINQLRKKKKYKNFKYIALDEYRFKYNKKNTIEGEEKAQLKLIEDIQKYKDIILESSGTGKWYESYLKSYESVFDDKIIEIILEDTIENCLLKNKTREKVGYQLPPFPYDIPLTNGLSWIHNKLLGKYADENIIVKNKKETFKNIYDTLELLTKD